MACLNKTDWKRVLLIGLVLIGCTCQLRAQTFQEWFQQKKTQKKYLLQQIVALQVYLGYLKEGYKIVNRGLTTIHHLKNGEVNLHRDFFGSLKGVNPRIRNWAKVADIAVAETRLVQRFGQFCRRCQREGHLTPAELDYLLGVYARFAEESAKRLDELRLVITAGEAQMTDDERMERIDRLYEDTRQADAFGQAFSQDTRLLSRQRTRETAEINTIRTLYSLPK